MKAKYRYYYLTLSIFILFLNIKAQEIAFTFDDGPHMDDTLFMSPFECNNAILRQLKDANIKAALFLSLFTFDLSHHF